MIGTWICLLLTGAIVWAWLNAMRAREIAVRFGHELCDRGRVQLLDQSVALRRLRVCRVDGNLRWWRRYSFEISVDGRDRHCGHLDMRGNALENWSLPWDAADAIAHDALPEGSPPRAASRLLDHVQSRAP